MTLLRTAFSTSVREAGDLSAGVFDPQGRMLAQAVTGTPGHVNTMAEAVLHFMAEIPREDMFEGDAYVTNDPWKGTGHLHDITMVSPSFLDGELVGFFACTAHVVDVGGRGFGADGKSVYEEGIQIPIMKFAERGEVNRDLVRILRDNVREPNQVVGDFYSLAACNDVGHRRLVDMMREFGLASLDALGDFIFSRTRGGDAGAHRGAAARAAGRTSWSPTATTSRSSWPPTVTIGDDQVARRFRRHRPVSRWGINVPAHLHQGLCLLRAEMRGRAGHPEQLRPRSPSSPCPRRSTSSTPSGRRRSACAMSSATWSRTWCSARSPRRCPARSWRKAPAALWNIHISVAAGRRRRRARAPRS